MTRIKNAERTRLFGKPCTPANHRLYITPWGIRVQVHKLVLDRFAAACVVAARESRWKPKRIDGYNCRTIRGSDAYSIHSWAMAWDFFATGPGVPPPGGVWTPDNPPDSKFVAAFTELGFTWGGTFSRKDTPHIEWAGAPPGATPVKASAPTTTPKENLDVTYRYTFDGAIWTTNLVHRQKWESGGNGFVIMERHTVDLGVVPPDFHQSLTDAG